MPIYLSLVTQLCLSVWYHAIINCHFIFFIWRGMGAHWPGLVFFLTTTEKCCCYGICVEMTYCWVDIKETFLISMLPWTDCLCSVPIAIGMFPSGQWPGIRIIQLTNHFFRVTVFPQNMSPYENSSRIGVCVCIYVSPATLDFWQIGTLVFCPLEKPSAFQGNTHTHTHSFIYVYIYLYIMYSANTRSILLAPPQW